MSAPLVVVVGFVGKLPFAGMTLYNLHHIVGLQELGYRIHYVEKHKFSTELYDPARQESTDDPSYALAYLDDVLPRYGVPRGNFSFVDLEGRCHGTTWSTLRARIREADFVIALADACWFEELALCPRRVFVDGDPVFTQAQMVQGRGEAAHALDEYPILFTIGQRMGRPDCRIPEAGRRWLPTRSVVATKLWRETPVRPGSPISTVMAWKSGKDVVIDGETFGHKNRQFLELVDLPRRTNVPLRVAIGGGAPKDRFREIGWEVVCPLENTGTIEAFARFIAGSRADLGIAKHAYVASRSGWFSDRSLCYLASGRPVLHQDTGFRDWLRVERGVLAFATLDDLVESIERLERDGETHARAARGVAERHFEARTVLARMLDTVDLRRRGQAREEAAR